MKNLFALNKENELIDINRVDKELNEKYHCCNCGNELIPRKGNVNAHHFSHKVETNCSYESYLHKLGKLKFYERYLECLNKKEKFEIDFLSHRICISCTEIQDINLSCKIDDEINSYDLTKSFDKISIEKSYKGFVADILLESSKSDEKLFIEFVVSHKCELIKIESGIRIVEINLSSEKDLDFIDNRQIKIINQNNVFYNFKIKQENKAYFNPYKCDKKFEVFSILKNNKAIKVDLQMKQILYKLGKYSFKYYKILNPIQDSYDYEYGESHQEKFIKMVQQSAFEVDGFKNCFSCRFSTENNNRISREMDGFTLFCKKLKGVLTNSNNGHNCDKYWRIEKPDYE